jgi:predicted DNA-binding transcriptional regulator AlpA
MSERLLTFPELKSAKGVPFSRQYVAELIRRKIFPAPVKTPGIGHRSLWLSSEVDQYIEAMKNARDTAPPDQAMPARVAKMLAGRRRKAGTVTIARRKSRQPAAAER